MTGKRCWRRCCPHQARGRCTCAPQAGQTESGSPTAAALVTFVAAVALTLRRLPPEMAANGCLCALLRLQRAIRGNGLDLLIAAEERRCEEACGAKLAAYRGDSEAANVTASFVQGMFDV